MKAALALAAVVVVAGARTAVAQICRRQCSAGEDVDPHGCCIPPSDRDRDGVPDRDDRCPDQAEDRDGFHDGDGCPDPDNDRDGVADRVDRCPNQAEDRDGYQDGDGCPDPDNDGDGVLDRSDPCPMEPEDHAGAAPDDGCPDPGPAGRAVGSTGTSEDLPVEPAAPPPSPTDGTGGGAPPVEIGPIVIHAQPSDRRHRWRGVARLDVAYDLGPGAWLGHVGFGAVWRDHLQLELAAIIGRSAGWQTGARWLPLRGAIRPSLVIGAQGVVSDGGMYPGGHAGAAVEWISPNHLGLGVVAELGVEQYLMVRSPLADRVWLLSFGFVVRP